MMVYDQIFARVYDLILFWLWNLTVGIIGLAVVTGFVIWHRKLFY